jgi:hypothetical protein
MVKLGELEGGAPAQTPLRVDLAPLQLSAWARGAYFYRLRLRFEDKDLSRTGTWFVYP